MIVDACAETCGNATVRVATALVPVGSDFSE